MAVRGVQLVVTPSQLDDWSPYVGESQTRTVRTPSISIHQKHDYNDKIVIPSS